MLLHAEPTLDGHIVTGFLPDFSEAAVLGRLPVLQTTSGQRPIFSIAPDLHQEHVSVLVLADCNRSMPQSYRLHPPARDPPRAAGPAARSMGRRPGRRAARAKWVSQRMSAAAPRRPGRCLGLPRPGPSATPAGTPPPREPGVRRSFPGRPGMKRHRPRLGHDGRPVGVELVRDRQRRQSAPSAGAALSSGPPATPGAPLRDADGAPGGLRAPPPPAHRRGRRCPPRDGAGPAGAGGPRPPGVQAAGCRLSGAASRARACAGVSSCMRTMAATTIARRAFAAAGWT